MMSVRHAVSWGSTYIGTPTAQRGGRRRKHYLLDTAGQRALVRAYTTFAMMTAGLQGELDELTQRMSPAVTRVPQRVSW